MQYFPPSSGGDSYSPPIPQSDVEDLETNLSDIQDDVAALSPSLLGVISYRTASDITLASTNSDALSIVDGTNCFGPVIMEVWAVHK